MALFASELLSQIPGVECPLGSKMSVGVLTGPVPVLNTQAQEMASAVKVEGSSQSIFGRHLVNPLCIHCGNI